MTTSSARLSKAARIATLLAASAVFVYLVSAFLLAAFRSQGDVVAGGIIDGLSFQNLVYNWQQIVGFGSGVFLIWLQNSLIVALFAAAVAVFAAVSGGYALARLRFAGRKSILFATLLTMVIPNTVLVIPIFLGVAAVGMVGKLLPVIIIMAFFPFGVYLAFIHFSSAMPKELVEAARVDGCSELGIFARIALPISKQPIALVFFFAFVADWTNYFLPLVLLPSTKSTTVPVGLQQMISQSQLYDPTAAAGLNVELYIPQLVLAALVQAIPVLIVFLSVQRYLVRGVTVGAVKG